MMQLQLSLSATRQLVECKHPYGFVSQAYVPAGFICTSCGLLTHQYLPEPPEVLGYLSGTWAWGIRHQFRWTTNVDGRCVTLPVTSRAA